jgi:hypothetical protein
MKTSTFSLVTIFFLLGCVPEEATSIRPKYKIGQTVYIKLDNRKGMIVDAHPGRKGSFSLPNPSYKIRVVSRQQSSTNVATGAGIGSGGTVTQAKPYQFLYLQEFELNENKINNKNP